MDLSVSRFEKDQELQEVLGRLENKSLAKLKNDKVFRKQDLRSPQRGLQHKGLVYWKTATGRLKGEPGRVGGGDSWTYSAREGR